MNMSVESTQLVPLWIPIVLSTLLILYLFFDIAYFIRMMYTMLKARYFMKNICVLEKTVLRSWCFLNDIDTLLFHMNNARYLRELDFARAEFYERTGLWASIKQAGGAVVQGATTIRYRRYIKPYTTFVITSRIVYWDDKTIFMDHEFVSADGFVNAVATCRQRVIGCGASTVLNMLHQLHCNGTCKTEMPIDMPPEIAAWVQANEISSAKLRKPECKCDPEKCQCQLPNMITMVDSVAKVNGHAKILVDQHSYYSTMNESNATRL